MPVIRLLGLLMIIPLGPCQSIVLHLACISTSFQHDTKFICDGNTKEVMLFLVFVFQVILEGHHGIHFFETIVRI